MFTLICVWINGCVNNREAGDLRRYCAHYGVTVMDTVDQNGGNFSGLLLVHVKIMYVVVKITIIWAILAHWSKIGDLSPHWSNQKWCNTILFNRHFDKIAYFQTMIYHTIIGWSVYKAKYTTILKVGHVRLRWCRWSFCIESKTCHRFNLKTFFRYSIFIIFPLFGKGRSHERICCGSSSPID